MGRTLTAGVAGLGVGEQHAKALAGIPSCRLEVVCDLDRGRAEAVAARTGAARVETDVANLIDDPALDLIALATYDDHHFAQVMQAMRRGKHVFVEKPLCRTVEEAREVKREWARGGRPHLASNLVLRSAPLYRWLREEIAAGAFGEIYAIDGDYLYGRLHKITDGWRKDVEGYSVMTGGGVHMVDLMMWLTGQRPAAVATVGNRIASKDSGFRYDDFAAATFVFPSGLIGRITANFGCVHTHHHVLRVFGTRATFLYDDQGPRVHRTREALPAGRVDHAPLPASKGDLVPGFVDAILGGADPAPPMQHELDVISACAAADRARASGQQVSVEYV